MQGHIIMTYKVPGVRIWMDWNNLDSEEAEAKTSDSLKNKIDQMRYEDRTP